MNQHYVFVYGTLRKNEGNHHLLRDAVCIARQCWTEGQLYDSLSGFPFLVQSTGAKVYGELYRINDLQLLTLDQLEGYQGLGKYNLFDRKEQMICTDSGRYKAFLYVLPDRKQTKNMKMIKSGDWSVDILLKKKKPILYFAYGSCMDHDRFQQAGVNHHFQNVKGCGILDGYQLRFTRRSHDGGRADIVESEGKVEGKIYEISSEVLPYLYKREGVNSGCYRPALVDLTLNGKPLHHVLTFVVINKETETAPPNHYVKEIFRGGKGYLSESYLEKIKTLLKERFDITV
jgi:gamma-glutamylcyclotransferase (GGCT)/AIG2-like uncharacterized protein YtfP